MEKNMENPRNLGLGFRLGMAFSQGKNARDICKDDAEFENKHPRNHGKFAKKGTGTVGASQKPQATAKQGQNETKPVQNGSIGDIIGNVGKHGIEKSASALVSCLKANAPTPDAEGKIAFKDKVKFEDLCESAWLDYEESVKKLGTKAHLSTSGIASRHDRAVEGFSDAVQGIYDRKVATEKQRTADIADAFKQLGGCQFSGLPNSIKAGSSTARKIRTKISEDKKDLKEGKISRVRTPEEIMSSLKDIVRYTGIVPHDQMTEKVNGIAKILKAKGYKVSITRNSYTEENPTYKGVHLGIYKDGEHTELQIHSPDSIEIKHMNHPWYNVERDEENQPEEARKQATQKMIENSRKLRSPKGLETLQKGEL